MTPDLADRRRGLLVGLAVGDALGAPVEFEAPEQIAGRRDELLAMPGGGSFAWAPGEFTDDTQMAIVLARRLLADGGLLDQQALAGDFAAWARDAADVGTQTRGVLDRVARGERWVSAIDHLSPDAEGNGSLMRTAPSVLAATELEHAMSLAARQSEVTHPALVCVDACRVFTWTAWALLHGGTPTPDEIASAAQTKAVRAAVLASDHAPAMSGWVIPTLTGALWAVASADGFEDAVWRAVSLGRDADTVGAIAGALAGARWGLAGIDPDLIDRLCSHHPQFEGDYPDLIIGLADRLGDLGS